MREHKVHANEIKTTGKISSLFHLDIFIRVIGRMMVRGVGVGVLLQHAMLISPHAVRRVQGRAADVAASVAAGEGGKATALVASAVVLLLVIRHVFVACVRLMCAHFLNVSGVERSVDEASNKGVVSAFM